jgi:2-keto-3-deoxy-L-rhamnonate aldolase RhmA
MMIESTEGIKNADAIAAVPGVGAIFLGAGSDLRQSANRSVSRRTHRKLSRPFRPSCGLA